MPASPAGLSGSGARHRRSAALPARAAVQRPQPRPVVPRARKRPRPPSLPTKALRQPRNDGLQPRAQR
jgi:hypothetical protein